MDGVQRAHRSGLKAGDVGFRHAAYVFIAGEKDEAFDLIIAEKPE